ncbi:MAG TPA: hypothetical protein VMT12_04365, partial [Syntrophales bacterium]|nr:hypothetical protein [Syntrophales bacterium]
MKKVVLWIAVVTASFMLQMMFAQASSAQAPGVGGPRSAWTLGIPGYSGLYEPEAIRVESGKVEKVEPMKGVKDGLQMRFV